MTIKSATLRPGFLVSLKTTISGNVKYSKVIVEQDRETEEGALIGRWETERVISDRREHEEAVKVRAKARNSIVSVCTQSAFGLLCPETSIAQLEKLVEDARILTDEFNARARLTRIHVYIITGRIAADDAEAVRALNSEVRDLLSTIETGIRKLDVKAIREAANKARDLGRVLSPSAQEQVNVAIVAAREAAKKIVKGGETAAVEVDLIALDAIKRSRTAFLDLDGASEIATPASEGRALDFAPDTVIKVGPHVAPQIEL